MKKRYVLSTALLGTALFLTTEAMAWQFQVLDGDVWQNAGQTLSFTQSVAASTGFDTSFTSYGSYTNSGDPTTYYQFWPDGFETGFDSSSQTLDAQYRVVSDWGANFNEAPSEIALNASGSFTSSREGDEFTSSAEMEAFMYNSGMMDNTVIETDVTMNSRINDIFFSDSDRSSGEGSWSDTTPFADTTTVQLGKEYKFYASIDATAIAENVGMMYEGLLVTDQDLIDAGFADANGNANPDAVIGDGEWFGANAETAASMDISLSIDGEEVAPGYVPPTVDLGDDPIEVGDIVDPMMPTATVIGEDGSETWIFDDFWVQEEGLYAFDPTYAIGYEYTLDDGSILDGFYFDDLLLLLGSDLDDTFNVSWDGNTEELSDGFGVGSNPFNFNGDEVTTFIIEGIEWETEIDPLNPFGFPTLIGFNKPGAPAFTMTPITEFRSDHPGQAPVPEPGTMLLFGIGLAGLVAFRKNRLPKKLQEIKGR